MKESKPLKQDANGSNMKVFNSFVQDGKVFMFTKNCLYINNYENLNDQAKEIKISDFFTSSDNFLTCVRAARL